MWRRAVLGFLVAVFAEVSATTRQRNAYALSPGEISRAGGPLVGTWRLVSRVVRSDEGTAIQDPGLGATPTGYLMYDSSGHMAAQIMGRDRPTMVDCGAPGDAPRNNSQSVNGYDAYFGTYTVDRASHTVTHHLEGALAAADVGKSLVRTFEVSGDKLNIVVGTTSQKGKQIRILTWQRVR